MKNISEKRGLLLYVIIAIIFVLTLGVLFTQIANHFVKQAYEEQVRYDVEYIATQLENENNTTAEIQEKLYLYKEYFPIELYYVNKDLGQHIHTFQSNTDLMQKIRSDYINRQTREPIMYEDRIIYPHHINDIETLIIASDPIPIQYLSQTIWWISIILAIFIAILIWVFGNRLYENYFKPIRKATQVAESLAEGNYKARIHDSPYGIVSQLGQSLNSLARNLEYITDKYQEQNNRLKTVVNNMTSGLLLINEKGITRLVNESFVKHFINKENYIGEIYYDVINHQKLNEEIQNVIFLEQNRQVTIETEDKLFFEVYLAPIRGDEEGGKGVVVVCHDITKIKRLENVRKDFVANVSHELKTPITSIQGFAETLLDGNDHDKETVKHFLSIIEKESKRLNALISDLLYLSSVEQDDFYLNKSNFIISELMNDVEQVVKSKIEDKNIEVSLNISPDHLMINADYNRMYQVILNLFANAVQYTPNGGQISWHIYKSDSHVIFEIKDTGIGIPKEDTLRIFERFYRVDRDRSRETGGTGLGLSIVKHIVEQHKGNIKVDSEIGKGTTIKISIPQTSYDNFDIMREKG